MPMLGFSLIEKIFLFTYHLIVIYYLISSITLRDASSETAALSKCAALEITAVATTGRFAAPPPRPPPAGFSRSAPTREPQRPSPPTSPTHQDRVPPLLRVFVGIIAFCLYLHQQTNKTQGWSFSLFAVVVGFYQFLFSHKTRAGPRWNFRAGRSCLVASAAASPAATAQPT
jgi:hypothetical protein